MNCKFTCGYGTIITIFSFLVLININNNFDIVYAQTTTTIPNFKIAAVGDWGCNSNTDKNVQSMLSKGSELVLGLGDYSYESDADCWLETISPINDR
ncbi:MAG: hypothetical protein QOK67_10885, partial [Nitrososphaeraceae archaeon]|nr:hypothetical protein [Nitrososphaeraceae archaeon]